MRGTNPQFSSSKSFRRTDGQTTNKLVDEIQSITLSLNMARIYTLSRIVGGENLMQGKGPHFWSQEISPGSDYGYDVHRKKFCAQILTKLLFNHFYSINRHRTSLNWALSCHISFLTLSLKCVMKSIGTEKFLMNHINGFASSKKT
jgi:hypothetical protein